ncbi:MAG TPA: heparin lyase I family protein [Polyangia bacterium]
MKNSARSWPTFVALFVALLGAFLAFPEPARATVVWTSTLEKGDLSEWSPGVNPTKTLPGGTVRKNVEVLGEQVYTGKFACKITVHPDDLFGQFVQDRVDIQHKSTLTDEGKDTWVSGHYMMPANAGVRNEFAFWESNVTSQNIMDFWVEPKASGGTTVNFGVGFLGATKLWTADFSIGKWHQVAIHVHWSVDKTKGSIDVWFDGQQVVTAAKAQTKPDTNTLFYQNGLHRKVMENFTDTIYFDDFIEADTMAEAQIAAPVQPGAVADAGTDAVDAGGNGGGGAGGVAGAGAGGGGGTAGAAGLTGAAGNVTGAAGSTVTGAAGQPTGAAGATGAAGTSGHGRSSGGCATGGRPETSALGLAAMLALTIGITWRRRRSG